MDKIAVKIFLLIAVIFVLLPAIAQGQLLGTACEPYGSISIKGEPAADNLPVIAYINSQEFARCQTLGGQYALVIARDNPDTREKEGWAEDDVVIIKINGTEAGPSFAAEQGRVRHDLSVTVLSIRLDTWGKIKALFK